MAIPENWNMSMDEFEKKFSDGNNKLFSWLTEDRTRAKISRKLYSNTEIDVTAFGGEVKVQEVIVDFADGKLNLISMSIYNRADSGSITLEDLDARYKVTGKAVGTLLGTTPQRKTADKSSGLLTEGFSWYSQKTGSAVLEHNEGALGKSEREFLRLRMARPGASGSLAASMLHSRGGAAVRQGDLQNNVTKNDEGDVMIGNVPMVDQGDKGYCVVATTQRVFEYYGIGADMHQIAQISKADPSKGTSTLLMAKELDKIDYRFNTRLDIIGMGQPLTEVEEKNGEYYVGKAVEERKFFKELKSNIDKGMPLLWSLELGRYPEVPQLNPQTAGGHMRLIIGYNDEKGEIIFSDSWGAGHEDKRMKMSDAYNASHGLFVLRPTSH